MNPQRLSHWCARLLACLTIVCVATTAAAQLAMLSVSPNSAEPGDSNVRVTATLSTAGLPPDQVDPTAMAIGPLSGQAVSRNGADVAGDFTFPSDQTAGTYTVTVTFPSPEGDLTTSLANGFTIGQVAEVTTTLTYAIVDTNQSLCYNADGSTIGAPDPGSSFYGQDAQFNGLPPSYTVSEDGLTVYDQITRLTWVKRPDLNGDNAIDVDDKLTADEAELYPQTLNDISYGGFDDWRLPSTKELYSLMDFSGFTGMSAAESQPYLNTGYLDFAFGDETAGERFIDSQWAVTTRYVSTVMDGAEAIFGVNFADGRIKGYGLSDPMGGEKTFYVRCVRGNTLYGQNDFQDNNDGTVTDRATGLMWTKADSGTGLNWEQALAYVEGLNASKHLGHQDWRLPNIKELQSLTDYSRSPDTTSSAAIDPVFEVTAITDEGGGPNYPFFWSSTTHVEGNTGNYASYVAFGEALGFMEQPPESGNYVLQDVHGAGAQRSDPKDGDPADYPNGLGPQGDVIRIFNFVRPVRDADIEDTSSVSMWQLR